MSSEKPTCPKCKGPLSYAPADVLGPERITCKLCGWYTERHATAPKPIPEGMEMAKTYRGVCPLCKRDDVLLISKNGECHRCYKRGSMGQNPLDNTRKMPTAPVKRNYAPRVAKVAPVIHPAPKNLPALVPGSLETEQSRMLKELTQLFESKANEWVHDLTGATSIRSRCKMFIHMTDSIESLGY